MTDPAVEYPEFLTELAEQMTELLVGRGLPADQAAEIGREAAERVRQTWGGIEVYIPKGRSFTLSQRDLEIWNEWNGRNVVELCRKHDLTEQRLYQILDAARRRGIGKRQGKLFDDNGG